MIPISAQEQYEAIATAELYHEGEHYKGGDVVHLPGWAVELQRPSLDEGSVKPLSSTALANSKPNPNQVQTTTSDTKAEAAKV